MSKILLKKLSGIFEACLILCLITPFVLSDDKAEKVLKESMPDDIISRTYFLETWKFLKEKENELCQFNFAIKTDFSGNEAGTNTASKLNIIASASKGIYPYEIEFETGSSFSFQNLNKSSVFSENIVSTRINYERYFCPWIEGFAFLERFSDSYLHLDQRYEIGAGTKIELDLFWEEPPELDKELRWERFLLVYRKLLIEKSAIDLILASQKITNILIVNRCKKIEPQSYEIDKKDVENHILNNIIQIKKRIEVTFDQKLQPDSLLPIINILENKYPSILLREDSMYSRLYLKNNFLDELEKRATTILQNILSKLNEYKDREKIYKNYEVGKLQEELKTVEELLARLENLTECFDKIKTALAKRDCSLQLGISTAIFYELDQYKGNFSYEEKESDEAEKKIVSSVYLLPPEDKLRFSIRPSLIFRISESLELAAYLYYKGMFGENQRIKYSDTESLSDKESLTDYRLDFYSYLKIRWPLKDSWAKNISMSAFINFNYINIPPYLDDSVIREFRSKYPNLDFVDNKETDYSETKHLSYGLSLEIKF